MAQDALSEMNARLDRYGGELKKDKPTRPTRTPGGSAVQAADGLRPAEETYLERAAGPRETFTRARRPATIMLACLAGTVAGISAFVASTWRWGASDPAARAEEAVSRTGMGRVSPGDVLLYDVVLGVLALLVWAAVVTGIWRGVRWVRLPGLLVGAAGAGLAGMALSTAGLPVERVTAWTSLVASTVFTALLLLPHREWFDWRRHGPTVAPASR